MLLHQHARKLIHTRAILPHGCGFVAGTKTPLPNRILAGEYRRGPIAVHAQVRSSVLRRHNLDHAGEVRRIPLCPIVPVPYQDALDAGGLRAQDVCDHVVADHPGFCRVAGHIERKPGISRDLASRSQLWRR